MKSKSKKVVSKTQRKRVVTKRVVTRRLAPVTPGELLLEDFMEPMGLTAYRLAKEVNVPAQRIGEILKGKRAITADTDLRLCRFLGLSNGYWLRAQVAYDIEVQESKIERALQKIKPWAGSVA